MAQEPLENEAEQESSAGIEIISWEVPEYHRHVRGKWWYLLYAVAAIGLLTYAVLTGNFLFAVIIVMGSFVLIINDARRPTPVAVVITTEGVIIGNRFYDYDEIENFSIVYKPGEGIKRLYFEFKRATRHRVSLSLLDINPLFLRESLLQYLPENLERKHESLSESLTKLLKL